jgi:ankyrin repeat protein
MSTEPANRLIWSEPPTDSFGLYAFSLGSVRASVEAKLGDEGSVVMEELRSIAERKEPAANDVKYWGGDPQPWRNGTDDSPVLDPDVIEREEVCKADAEADDLSWAPTTEEHADRLHQRGITADFLVYLTFACDLWEWKTWEVVQFLVKPATERLTEGKRRCFADILPLGGCFGPAKVFASHCWAGKWGDLVAAVCAGGDTQRMVWIDIFAVRQWPGNGADLDFRGVIQRSAATIVAMAVVDSSTWYLRGNTGQESRLVHEFRESAEYALLRKSLPFCRLWCLVELFTTIIADNALIFRCVEVKSVNEHRAELGGRGVSQMLINCARIINVEDSQCAVQADRVREMAAIERDSADLGGFPFVNKSLAKALNTGGESAMLGIVEVDNFLCGEPAGLRNLPIDKVNDVVHLICSAGLVDVLDELLRTGGILVSEGERAAARGGGGGGGGSNQNLTCRAGHPLTAGMTHNTNFSCDVCTTPLNCGVRIYCCRNCNFDVCEACVPSDSPDRFAPMDSNIARAVEVHRALTQPEIKALVSLRSPLHTAAENGQARVVARLLQIPGVDVNQCAAMSKGTALLRACEGGHEEVVEVLLADQRIGPSLNMGRFDVGITPLYTACAEGHEEVVKLLLARSDINVSQGLAVEMFGVPQTINGGKTALHAASIFGREAVVRLLLAHEEVDVNYPGQPIADGGNTPLYEACRMTQEQVVSLLLEKGADPSIVNTCGETPLHIAMELGHSSIVAMLNGGERT